MLFKKRAAILALLAVLLLHIPLPVAVLAGDASSGVGAGTGLGSGAGSGTGVGSGAGAGSELGSTAKPYRRDENYVDLQPGDVDIWDNGEGISVSGGGQVLSVAYRYSHYTVFVSKYLDSDGGYTLEVSIFLYGRGAYLVPSDTSVLDDGSVYSSVRYFSVGGMFSETQGYEYTIKLRGGEFMSSSGGWQESPVLFMSGSGYSKGSVQSNTKFYTSPYYSGKYKVYSSSEYVSSGCEGFPVNLLPNTPLGTGETKIPYKTTFRMLTDGTLTYNTFYYTSSYKSSADEISASGTIRLDVTKLADGTVERTRPTAPQLLCQVSTYGTAYDIVSTNDDNLISLLGIPKPVERYWDVAAQEWKVSASSGVGPGTGIGGGVITPDPGTGKGFEIDRSLSPLMNFSRWLQAKGYPVASNVVYLLTLESVGDFGELVADYLGLYTYNETTKRFGAASDGVSDLWKKVPEASIANAVTKEFTDRFSFDEGSGHYVWSPGAVASVSVAGLDLAIATGASGSGGSGPTPDPSPTPGGSGTGGAGTGGNVIIGGPQWDVVGDISSSVQTGIVDGISSTGSFLSGILSSARGLLADLGGVPALLASFFSFLPEDIITAIGVGLSLWLLPSLLGLARNGLKGFGNICSSFFSFISSFFR